MTMKIATVAMVLAAVPALGSNALGQSVMTGVSNPDQALITSSSDQVPASTVVMVKPQAAKPSAATPEVYGAYVPYRPAGGAAVGSQAFPAQRAFDPDANIVTETTRDATTTGTDDDGIVTSVAEIEGQVREGTLLKARIAQNLSTTSTLAGAKFTAPLSEDVMQNGRVILPAGSVLEGRVTEVHGGRRISGSAALHLEARSVTLPDGTRYVMHAQLIDTDQSSRTKLDSEGTVEHKDHKAENLGVLGLTAGSGAVAGAMIGGGVGAVVGAGLGAGVSTVLWLKQDRQAALPKNSLLVFSLTTPMILQPLSDGGMSRVGFETRSSLQGTAVTAVP